MIGTKLDALSHASLMFCSRKFKLMSIKSTPNSIKFQRHNKEIIAYVLTTASMQLNKDHASVVRYAQSILASVSEVIARILYVEIERENIINIVCYIYRASYAIMELQATENPPRNAMEILKSISRKIDLAKDLIGEFHKDTTKQISDPKIISIMSQLEEVINHLGEDLSLIPASAFEKFAAVAVRSLAQEMKKAQFNVSQSQSKEPKDVECLQKHKIQGTPTAAVGFNSMSQEASNAHFGVESLQEQEEYVQQAEVVGVSQDLQNASFGVIESQLEQPTDLNWLQEQNEPIADTVGFNFLSQHSHNIHAETSIQDTHNEVSPAHKDQFVEKDLEQLKRETPERDLYPVGGEFSMEYSQTSNVSRLIEFLHSSSGVQMKRRSLSRSTTRSSQSPEFMEPMYRTFFCPLTKRIMDDPVTIQSGVTYERKAIIDWFNKSANSEEICCPTTGEKLATRNFTPNIALKTTIDEWKERNEAGRMKAAKAALSSAVSATMVLEALEDLKSIYQGKGYDKVQLYNMGIIPLVIKFLQYRDRNVRCASLDLLIQLAQVDIDGKEIIANQVDLSTLIKMLSSSHREIRCATWQLLLDLSTSTIVCENISSVTGAILIFVTNKYNHADGYASEKADKILKNLEGHPNNIKLMAENGHMEPLLNHLMEGSEEMKIEMANHLAEIFLGHDNQTYVADRAAPSLIAMVRNGNGLTRRVGFKALAKISTHHPNSKALLEAGILQIMVEELFSRQINDDSMNSKAEAASILANVIESGLDVETIQVNSHGHTMSSDYVVYNIIKMMKYTTPEDLNISLLKVLLCLSKSLKSSAKIVSVVKESDASYILIQLINSPTNELSVAAIKLLMTLSSYIGHTLIERLCKTAGLPENLIRIQSTANQITERQAISAKLLAKLPHQNLTLNVALLDKDLVPEVLQKINQIQVSGMRASRYTNLYLEGLVGILVRFTTTLYEPQILVLARRHNFTSVFTELLMKTSSDEVQKLSAIGLENLSSESINLSKPPQVKKPKFMKILSLPRSLSSTSSKTMKFPICPIHRGTCSSQDTFCLVNAKAVDRLLMCLNHENVEVVEAALSALCTLLDDKVDVDKSVKILNGANALPHILNVVKDHRQEGLRQKSFWMIEKFLIKGGDLSASFIIQDRVLPSTLVTAFHHGDGTTKQMAERILRHLNKMPYCSTSVYTI